MDTQTAAIKDKYLAGGFCIILLLGYLFVLQNNFLENLLLFMTGVFGGLLKQQASPQTNVQSDSMTTNVQTGEQK